MKVTYQGQWVSPNQVIRIFNLHLPDGRCPTFAVGPGEDLKTKLEGCMKRFIHENSN